MKEFTLLDFVGMSNEELKKMDQELMSALEYKLVNLKYDDELNKIYNQLDLISREVKRRKNLDV
jgi:hypothetical protein